MTASYRESAIGLVGSEALGSFFFFLNLASDICPVLMYRKDVLLANCHQFRMQKKIKMSKCIILNADG